MNLEKGPIGKQLVSQGRDGSSSGEVSGYQRVLDEESEAEKRKPKASFTGAWGSSWGEGRIRGTTKWGGLGATDAWRPCFHIFSRTPTVCLPRLLFCTPCQAHFIRNKNGHTTSLLSLSSRLQNGRTRPTETENVPPPQDEQVCLSFT